MPVLHLGGGDQNSANEMMFGIAAHVRFVAIKHPPALAGITGLSVWGAPLDGRLPPGRFAGRLQQGRVYESGSSHDITARFQLFVEHLQEALMQTALNHALSETADGRFVRRSLLGAQKSKFLEAQTILQLLFSLRIA